MTTIEKTTVDGKTRYCLRDEKGVWPLYPCNSFDQLIIVGFGIKKYHGDIVAEYVERLEKRIAELEAKLEAAQTDSRRLDWLETISIEASCPPQSGKPCHKKMDFDCERSMSLREAIDVALKDEAGK